MLLCVFEARLCLGIETEALQGGGKKTTQNPNHKSSPLICTCSARREGCNPEQELLCEALCCSVLKSWCGEGLLLWELLTDEDSMEEGCLCEMQTRGIVELLSMPSPVPFGALSSPLPSGLGKEGRLSYSSMKISYAKKFLQLTALGSLAKN